MNPKIFIHIYGFERDEGRRRKRQIKQDLQGLGLDITIEIVEGESRDLFFDHKEVHAVVMYQAEEAAVMTKTLKTLMDSLIRQMDVIMLPVSCILSQNRTGLYV
jgi:hypothetical protein